MWKVVIQAGHRTRLFYLNMSLGSVLPIVKYQVILIVYTLSLTGTVARCMNSHFRSRTVPEQWYKALHNAFKGFFFFSSLRTSNHFEMLLLLLRLLCFSCTLISLLSTALMWPNSVWWGKGVSRTCPVLKLPVRQAQIFSQCVRQPRVLA